MPDIRTSKRSRRVALTSLTAASAVAISGCSDGSYQDWPSPTGGGGLVGGLYADVAACERRELPQERDQCAPGFAQVQAADAATAPRLESRELCEQEFGVGNCRSGGTYWQPLLAGVLMGATSRQYMSSISAGREGLVQAVRKSPVGIYRDTRSGHYFHGGPRPGRVMASGESYLANLAALDRPLTSPHVFTKSEIGSQGGFGGRLDSQGRTREQRSWGS